MISMDCDLPRSGPASAVPAGRMRAKAKAGSEWECHVEIEWIGAQLLTPHLGGLSAGRGAGVGAARQPRPRRSQEEVRSKIGL